MHIDLFWDVLPCGWLVERFRRDLLLPSSG